MWTITRVGYGLCLAALLGLPDSGAAQEAQEYFGAHLRDVQPGVLVQLAEEATAEEALPNAPFLPGDRIWTDATGRAEIQLSNGSLARLDVHSKLDLGGIDAGGATLNLWSGSILLVHPGQTQVEVLLPGGFVSLSEPGRYRIDVYQGDVRVSVYDGLAHLEAAGTRVRLASGERSVAGAGLPPEAPQAFDPWAEHDAFVAYSDDRDATLVAVSGSHEYLPEPVQAYGADFDNHGSWYFEAEVGRVWRPHVSSSWRPYVHGRWVWTPYYGWTWVPYEPWGWATAHYGRWGHNSLGWYWLPGSVWSGAWVSWAVGPSYVAWCPLGYRDRPLAVPRRTGRHATPRDGFWGRGTPDDGGWSYVERGEMGRHARPRIAASGELRGGFAQAAPGRLDRDLTIASQSVAARDIALARPRNAAEARSMVGASSGERRLTATRPTATRRRPNPTRSGAADASRVVPRQSRPAPTAGTRAPAATRTAPRALLPLNERQQGGAAGTHRPIRTLRPADAAAPRASGRRMVTPSARPMLERAPAQQRSRAAAPTRVEPQRATRPTTASRPATARPASRVRSRDAATSVRPASSSRPARPTSVAPRTQARPASGAATRVAPRTSSPRSERSSEARERSKPPKR